VEAAAGSVLELLRTVRKAKARMTAGDDVESATQRLLHVLASEGPMRTSALASRVHSDLSTVSRQAGALVAAGRLERQADPADGRAGLLALTPAGEAVVAEYELARAAFFSEVLNDWTIDELRQFASLVGRFTTSYDEVHATRISKRDARRSAQPVTATGPAS
jgi:DNA-binding MarR family transcriptional regulator